MCHGEFSCVGGKVYFGPSKPTIMHIRLLLALPVAFALGCTPSLEEVHVEDLKDSCDCLEASEILFNTYADLTEEHKETIDAYIEAVGSGAEPPAEVTEKMESEVKDAFAIVEEKGTEIGVVCDQILNLQAVLAGVDSVDCPNVEKVRAAYERALGTEAE